MRYIKTFENNNQVNLIKDLCKEYDIKNYTINDDYSIDVDGNVNLAYEALHNIPLKFNRVYGDFKVELNYLTNLKGCPEYVSGDFLANNNKLESLEYCPKYVGGNFYIHQNNKLSLLSNCPEHVGGDFSASDCSLKSLKNISKYIGGDVYLFSNKLSSTKYLPSNLTGSIELALNPLPFMITKNISHIKYILEYQDEYEIWNTDGSLNNDRFNILMNDIDI